MGLEALGSSAVAALASSALSARFGWPQAAQVAGAVLVAVIVGVLFRRFVLGYFERLAASTENDVDDRLVYFFRRFYKGILAFVALLVVLKILDVELSPLLAGAGIAGIAIAYAAKEVLGNLLAGIFLLIDQPLKIGDRIQIERIGSDWGGWGDVVDVGLRTTTVRNTDGVHVTYPNAKLADSVIKNFTPDRQIVRFRTRILIDLDADVDRALELLVEAAVAHAAVLQDPAPGAVLRSLYNDAGGHAHQGALLELRCFTADVRKRTAIRSDLLRAAQKAFTAAGIALARPQVTITERSVTSSN